jgi:hypothetical protein
MLSEVAGAMNSWLRAPRVRELVEQWPFLRTWELAAAHERGEAVAVRWRQLRASAALSQDTGLQELVEAAFEQPRLRALAGAEHVLAHLKPPGRATGLS